ncbi:MAG: galactitol-1-phosphate 5-dehydrogenase [Chloroflexi bacterium]|nr:galactitol-1-phosphate 5-dehydrogenase [Chloroflexota bacterium]
MTSTSSTMQALMFTDFNRLELQTVPAPRPERPDDVLVRVHAASVCGSDLHGYTGKTGRRKPPLIMGHEVAGEVVAVGEAVTHVQPGDRVALHPLIYRPDPATGRVVRQMIGMNLPGAYAEYTVVPESNVYPIPDALPYTVAALTEPTAVAVHAVGLAPIRPYDRVLVIGAGTIGLLAMQVLRMAGAREVIVSDVSEARLAVARQMGALHTVNPSAQDFAGAVRDLTDAQGFDLTFEAVGISATVAQSVAAVRDGGAVVWIGNSQKIVEVDMQAIVTRELQVIGSYGMNERDFSRALAMLSDGRIDVAPLITRRAALAEGPGLFDELLRDEAVIKCVIEIP